MLSEKPRKSMANTAELRQIFPLRVNTLRHVVEGDGHITILLTIHDDKIRLIADKSLTNRAIGLRSRGDRTSKFGSSKVDGHAQNSGPAITNRKRSQTTHAWAYDQSCRVVPSITHAHGLTSRATGLATVTGQPCDWSCHLWNNFTTGSTIYYCQWRLVARP